MEAQEEKNGNISAKLIKAYTGEDSSISVTCTIVASATEKEAVIDYTPSRYREDILNGADPVLANELVPITIEDDGTVKKADITSEWYDYETKKWANAVILEDESITYNAGEVIPEDNIESYFVWIPKYSYQLWDLGEYDGLTELDSSKVHTIPVKFGLTNTSDSVEGECTTPMNADKTQGLSGESGNCQIGDYMTPPAFISMNTNGLWVGKFETGYKGATSKADAQVNSTDVSKLIVKPNVYSWRNITLGNAYKTSYNYKRELDSHMIKNTEWGAVAYLQHSIYGSATSVRINNNSELITGYSAVKNPTCGAFTTNEECKKYEGTELGLDGTYTINYKNPTSQVASTTGNYTGIYDMSGGAWELIMMIRKNADVSSSDLEINIEPKYYDFYDENFDLTAYRYRILGDGTSEFGPFGSATYGEKIRTLGSWYGNEAYFVSTSSPWFTRSGAYNRGLGSGILGFFNSTVDVGWASTFRLVLAP